MSEGGRQPGTAERLPLPEDLGLRDFSLVRGGPVYRFLRARKVVPAGFRGAICVFLILAAICLLPLVVLSALDGKLVGPISGVPLLKDPAALSRFLVALPALVLIAPDSDMLLRRALSQFVESGLVRPKDRPAFAGILRDTLRLRDAAAPELILIAIAFGPALLAFEDTPLLPLLPGWRLGEHGALSPAGLWFEFAAKPLWLFVALLWVWRLVLWTLMLLRICRLDLTLHAAHPDGVGGLGFVPLIQQRFRNSPLPSVSSSPAPR